MTDTAPAFAPDADVSLAGFYELVRVISVLEGAAVIVLVFWQVHLLGGWRTLDAGNRFRLSGVALISGAWSYGGIEAELMHVPGAFRSLFGAIALGYLALAYVMTVRDLRLNRGDEDGT